MAEINIFLTHKTKKKGIKSRNNANFGRKPEKLASNLKMNVTKMEKTLKTKKFMIIFVF